MLGGQGQLGTLAPHIEIGVTPAVEFAGTAQGLARATGVRVFAGVMNQQDGQLELALEFAQIREQPGDLAGVVFIHPVQSDQRVQDQQDRPELLDGVGEPRSIGGSVKPERRGGDDFHRQGGKGHLRGRRDAFNPLTHDRQRVFGWEEQDWSAAPDWKLPQAGGAGSDADGDIQSQKAFAAFGFAAQDADGLLGPETFHQPLGLRAGAGQLAGALNREGVHDFLAGLGSRAKTSK